MSYDPTRLYKHSRISYSMARLTRRRVMEASTWDRRGHTSVSRPIIYIVAKEKSERRSRTHEGDADLTSKSPP